MSETASELSGQPAGSAVVWRAVRLRTLRLAVGAVAGLAAVYLAWSLLGAGRTTLPRLDLTRLPLYLGPIVVVMLLRTLRWRFVLARMGAGGTTLARLAQLWLAGRAVGSLIPSGTLGGEPVRAELLAARGVPRRTAAGAVALDRTLELAGNMIAAPASIGAALLLGVGSLGGTLAATATALAGLTLFGFLYRRSRRAEPALATLLRRLGADRVPRLAGLGRQAASVDAALQDLLASHPRLVPIGVGLSLGIELAQLGELAGLFALFGLVVPLPLFLLSSVGIGVARVVPVSAALGSLEAAQVGVASLAGGTLALGLTVGLVLRCAETLWIVVGLLCLATATTARSRASGRGRETAPAPHPEPS